MKTKICTKCERRRRADKFGVKKKTGKLQSWCKECTNDRVRELRRTNEASRKKNIDGIARRRAALQEEVSDLKRNPCVDCERSFNPWQMHYDHVRGVKLGTISQMVARCNRDLLFAEIEKCELVCACCHADRTYQRMQQQQ